MRYLIISDIRMPGIDGFQLITGVKKSELNKRTPVVVITGYLDEPEERALLLGAVKVFIKPLRTSELLEWIEKRIKLSNINIEKFNAALNSGVQEVLEFYIQETVTLETPESAPASLEGEGLVGIIHFIGGDFKGYMALSLENSLVAEMGQKTFGDEYDDEIASEIVGELCNQALGKVIAHFSKLDITLSLDIGIPEVLTVGEKQPHFFHAANYTIRSCFTWNSQRCIAELIMN